MAPDRQGAGKEIREDMMTFSPCGNSAPLRPYELPGEFDPALIEHCEWDRIYPDENGCMNEGTCEVHYERRTYWLCPDCEEKYYERIKDEA